jgi:hypothetical protein
MGVDCDASTAAIDESCSYPVGATFSVAVHALSAGPGYIGFQAKLTWTDAVLDYLPNGDIAAEGRWPGPCSSFVRTHEPATAAVVWGCTTSPAVPSTYTGPLVELQMQCVTAGQTSLALVPRAGDPHFGSHFLNQAAVMFDPVLPPALQVTCEAPPTATATATPTATSTATPTLTPKNPDGDTDGDTIANSVDVDDDNDGCLDTEELGPNPALGGMRNPHDPWDLYDVPAGPTMTRDDRVTIWDISGVLNRFGSNGDPGADPHTPPPPQPAYHPAFDRSPLGSGEGWQSTAPDGIISIGDITMVAGQFSATCLAEP